MGASVTHGMDVFPEATAGMYSKTPVAMVTGQTRPATGVQGTFKCIIISNPTRDHTSYSQYLHSSSPHLPRTASFHTKDGNSLFSATLRSEVVTFWPCPQTPRQIYPKALDSSLGENPRPQAHIVYSLSLSGYLSTSIFFRFFGISFRLGNTHRFSTSTT